MECAVRMCVAKELLLGFFGEIFERKKTAVLHSCASVDISHRPKDSKGLRWMRS